MGASPSTTSAPKVESKKNCGPIRPSKSSKWRAWALVAVHVIVLVHFAHWKITGSSVTPLEPSEAMQTLELGYVNAGFLLFTGAILITMVVGRFFCGWACHVVAYQDACAWILNRLKLRPKPVRSRLLVWVPLGAAFYMFAWPTVYRAVGNLLGRDFPWPTWTWHLSTDDLWKTFPGPFISVLTLVWVGAIAVWFLGAKGFCTYGCPYGAVFGIAERASTIRIRVTDDCERCGHCTAVCTSNVRVHEEVNLFKMVVDAGCMKCLDCVSVCPKDALYVGAGPIPAMVKPSHVRPVRHWDYTWPEELAMAGIFAIVFWSFRGLYHAVPFLFALGIGSTVAWLIMTAIQTTRGKALTWNGARLRAPDGRLSKTGHAIVVAAIAASCLTIHAGILQWNLRDGLSLKAQVESAPVEAHVAPAWKADVARARATLDRCAAISYAPDVQLTFDRADLARLGGDFATAERLYAEVIAQGTDTPLVRARLGDLALAQNQPDRAQREYLDALAKGSTDFALWTRLADIAMARGDAKEAARCLEKFLESQPLAQPIRQALAEVYESIGETERAQHHRKLLREAASKPTGH